MGKIIERGPRSEMRFADVVTRMSFVAYSMLPKRICLLTLLL